LRIITSSIIVALLFLSLFVFAFTIQPAKASSGTIYINSDGSITPSNANITTSDNVTYTFTGNNYLPIVVNRSNIIINGMGHTLQAPGKKGFYLSSVSNVTIKNTIITNSRYGIYLNSSSGNTLSGNNITANSCGIWLDYSSGNRIFHNDFLNNTQQAGVSISNDTWDDGYPSGGNYWSDYRMRYPNAAENDSSAIWNTSYVIDANNIDNYPLMGMYYEFFPSFFSNRTVSVIVISNSTVSDLIYSIWLSTPYDGLQGGQPFIEFLTSGQNGSIVFCRVMIPRTILKGSSYTVWVDYNQVNATELPISNSTYVYLYFTYALPKQAVIITLPEYASFMLWPLFIIITLLGAIVIKRKRNAKK
jgi:parallel beta-helix repeat protein